MQPAARTQQPTSPRPTNHPTPRYRYVRPLWLWLIGWIDFFGWRLRAVGQRLFRPPPPCPVGQIRRILIVQLDHLGDALLTTAILPELRRRCPLATIDVLAAEWNHEVFVARDEINQVDVSRVNRFRRGPRWGWLAATLWWGWKLRRRRYDMAIDVRGEIPLALLTWLTGAPRRVGWNAGGGGFLLTHSPTYVVGRSEVESRFELLRVAVELSPDELTVAGPRFAPSPTARRTVAGQWADLHLADKPVIVLHIGAGTAAKRWPISHQRELLGRLVVEYDVSVILVGSDHDTRRAREITDGQNWPAVYDWTGLLSLDQLAAVIERATAFVGVDSGPAHLAAAVDRPVVVLFSGTNDPAQWKPWGSLVRVVRHWTPCSPCRCSRCQVPGHPCMQGLTPRMVLDALEALCPDVARRGIHHLPPVGPGTSDWSTHDRFTRPS